MNNSVTEEIKEKLSIEEVVSSYIKLEKSGINLKARCPFHNEKTASFFVSPDRGSFYCFGCSKGGDIFSFVEEIEGVDFKDALKILAEKSGVDISKFQKTDNKSQKIDDTLYTILEKATMFFEKELKDNQPAQKYLKDRGIELNTISKFRIGYVKDEWQSLYEYLKKENYSDDQIIKTGLVIKNDNGRIYDRFRGRVVFPIFDDRGRTIAYSARILTDEKDQPKYINSPETVFFNKSKTLYGFNFAKQTIRKHDFAILVEGQMDVIMTHQMGYTNTVASSGTSFTEDQLKMIKRHTDNLLIAFDGDSAGLNSSKKVWEMALSQDMDVKILPLKEGDDPADIILKDQDEWKRMVKRSRHIIEHLIDSIKTNNQDTRKQQKLAHNEIYPYVRSIKSYTDKSFFVEKIAENFGIERDAVWADVNSVEKKEVENIVQNTKIKKEFSPREVLYGVYLSKDLKDKDSYWENVKQFISEDLIVEMEKRKDKILFELDLLLEQYKSLESLVGDMYSSLEIKSLEVQKQKLNKELQDIDEDAEKEAEIMKKMLEITRKLESVKKVGCNEIQNMV